MPVAPKLGSRGVCVLVVDDDAGNRLMVRAALEESGYRVEEAEDGESGLRLITDGLLPDLVLLDIVMPGMDGYATCEAIRKLPDGRHIPIIMMTGLDHPESIEQAYDAGATDFVTKPVNFLLLRYRLRYALRAKQTADNLRTSRARLSKAQSIARIGHWEWNIKAQKAEYSDGVRAIFGVDGLNPFLDLDRYVSIVHSDDRERVRAAIEQAIVQTKPYTIEHRIMTPSGIERIVRQEAEFEYPEASCEPCAMISTIQDITERRLSEDRIHYLVHYDELTELPNRTLFSEYLERAIVTARRYDRAMAVMLFDLDHFKRFNETLGYAVGDQLLKAVAKRFRRCIRSSDCVARGNQQRVPDTRPADDTVARLGGDEFVVLLSEMHSVEDALLVVKRMTDALAAPFTIDGDELHISASVGISVYPLDGDDPDALLKHAEVAMNHAKEQGRNLHQFYTASLNARAQRQFSIETQLRKALEAETLEVHYQPIIDLANNRVAGAEALVRWPHADIGMVPPQDFIPIAEKTDLILPLGQWVLQRAFQQTRCWQDTGLDRLTVSINLSAVQFKQKNLASQITGMLQHAGLNADLVDLELTEGLLLEDKESSVATLAQLRDIGFGISIDDFGTGYSSLSYLKRFPLSALKIDRSFVNDLERSDDNAAIINAIILLGHSLRLKIVAEGVEKREQLEFLREHGCDKVQGFHYSRALPAEAFRDWALAFNGTRTGERRAVVQTSSAGVSDVARSSE